MAKYKELILHLLFWVFYFSAINVEWGTNWLDKTIRPNTPAQIIVLFFPVFFYANAFWAIPKILKGKNWIRYTVVIILIVCSLEFLRSLITIVLMPELALDLVSIEKEIFSRDSFLFGSPSIFWLALIGSFAYRFTKDRMANTKLIEQLKTEKLQMELSVLKSHVNPHFLFNNLNALDDLIERDKDLAKNYLHRLSNMYRYFITSLDDDVVSLQEEWNFIDDYIYLIEERYGHAYKFNKINELGDLGTYLIPPASLQGLIENVVKHNQSSVDKPLKVEIKVSQEGLCVSHLKKLKTCGVKSLGTGLKNLKSRYNLLSNQSVIIRNDKVFEVLLPLIKQLK